jgi:pimeloyl-ACP methyl ester carboxylesterase
MEEVRLAHARIRYRDGGSGPAIVFLHGLLVDGRLWRKVTPHLDGEFRCVVPDLPLGSHTIPTEPGADLTLPGLARMVAELLERLDLSDVVLVGNDTGGAIAQVVATRHPERIGALVLTPCDAFDNFLPPIFRPLTLAARVPPLLTALVAPMRLAPMRRLPVGFGWVTKRPVEPREVEDGWLRPFLTDPAIRRDVVRVLRGVDAEHTRRAADELRSFGRPALIAWAREDRIFPLAHAQRLAELIPDARLEMIDDAYAFVPEDQPERTAELIGGFAREVNAARRAEPGR